MRHLPLARADLERYDLGDDMLLYDRRAERAHLLDPAARAVWELCDGTRDSEKIRQEVARRFPRLSEDKLRRLVTDALTDLEEKEVLSSEQFRKG